MWIERGDEKIEVPEGDFQKYSLAGKGWVVSADQNAPVAPIINGLTAALEAHYDAVAKAKRYDNRITCALRAGYAGPFQSEGAAFAVWMDTCNAYGYQVMADCLSGERTIPTAEELISELPAPPWSVA